MTTKNKELNKSDVLPFEDESNKSLIPFSPNILGLPNSYSGMDRKNNFTWNKSGVAIAYMIVPVLKSAIDVISQNLANVPMVLKKSDGTISKRSDTSGASESPFLYAIEKSYKYYGMPLMQLWGTSYLMYGETFIEKVPTVAGSIIGLKWLNPLFTSVFSELVEDDDIPLTKMGYTRRYEVKRFTYSGRYGYAEYNEDEVLYSRNFNPTDDIKGYGDALSALGKANISVEFERFTMSFYDNNGHPAVIISPKDKLLTRKDVVEWRRQWQQKFRGAENAFKTHLSSYPFDVSSFELVDISKPLEVSKDAENKLLSAFRVSPEMIGLTSDNSYQFSKETKNSFMQTVVRPIATVISNAINHSGVIAEISESESDLKFGFDFSEYENVAKSDLDRQDVIERQLKSGGMSLHKYQEKIGQEPIPNTEDVYLIPQGFVVVKQEDIQNPDNIQQPSDQRGPDSSSFNQSDRPPQNENEDEDQVEFNSSKSITMEEVESIAEEMNIPLEEALSYLDEFKDVGDYEPEKI